MNDHYNKFKTLTFGSSMYIRYANIRVIKFKRRNWVCKIRFQNHHPHLFLTFADLSGAPKVTIMGKDRQMKKNNRPIFARAASWIFKRRIALSLNGVTRLYPFFIRKIPAQFSNCKMLSRNLEFSLRKYDFVNNIHISISVWQFSHFLKIFVLISYKCELSLNTIYK